MNTTSILTLLATLNMNARKISLCNLITLQNNLTVEIEISIGLASPLSALVENMLDQMVIT